MKNTYILLVVLLLFASISTAQVGIGTTDPKAQLDIQAGNVATPSSTDGILIPRVNALPATNPGADQNGMLVFLTTSNRFYYWDNASTSWRVVNIQKLDDLADAKSDSDGTDDGSSVFIGVGAGAADDQSNNFNVGIGLHSLNANTQGDNNTATGTNAMYSNLTGTYNTALGVASLYTNTNGDENTAIGDYALANNSGSNNTALGNEAGYNATGNNNVFIGNQAGSNETGDHKLYIANTNADATNALIYGEFDNNILRTNGELQIGDPATNGYKFPTTRGTVNKVLQTNATGQLSWQDALPTGTTGDILYHNGTGWEKIPAGNNGAFLRMKNGAPVWVEEGENIYTGTTIFVQGGTFTMGSPNGTGDSDEHPEHNVTLSSFYISKYEITNTEYAAYMNAIGANADGSVAGVEYLDMDDADIQISYSGGLFVVDAGKDNFPVIEVSWYGAKAYCEYYGGRLPTEAEWEFAAKGGTSSNGYTYSGSNTLGDVAWYTSNSGGATHSVGTKNANELGLHDMSGNVWEWCNDWYDNNYYSSSPGNDPQGPATGTYRVDRGGGWGGNASYCRVANRRGNSPTSTGNDLGFRAVFLP